MLHRENTGNFILARMWPPCETIDIDCLVHLEKETFCAKFQHVLPTKTKAVMNRQC